MILTIFGRAFREAAVVLTLSALLGCTAHTVSQDIDPLVSVDDTYSFSYTGIEPHSRWWEAFEDSQLDNLIRESLSNSLTLQQAAARIEQAVAQEKQERSFLFPMLSGNASGNTGWTGEQKREDDFSSSLNLAWEIDLWGKLSSARKASAHEITASREDLEAAALLLTSQVADTYFQILEQKLLHALLNRQITVGETLLDLTELRFQYGEASIVDVFQQREQLASTRSQFPGVLASLRILENRLSVLLGRAPHEPFSGLTGGLPKLPELPSAGVPLELLQNRPDLRRIQNELAAADYRIAEAVADRLPEFNLTGSGGLKSILGSEGLFLNLLLESTAPLIDWGQRSAEVEERKARFREELLRYSQAYLIAIEEVENALLQEKFQADLLESLENRLSISRSTLSETRNRYRQGLTDYLPVLSSLQSLQELERDIILRRRQLVSFRILLYRSLGGAPFMSTSSQPSEQINKSDLRVTQEVKR